MALGQRLYLLALFCALACAAGAQAPGRFVGTIQAVRTDKGEVDVKPDQGDLRTVRLTPETIFQRVAPGEKDLKQAHPIQPGDLSIGDRVLAALEPGTDSLRRLVVMSSTDIAKRNETERLDWQKRGVSGVVAERTGSDITLKMRTLTGETRATVTVTDKTTFRRYAPDSVRFADAGISGLENVSVGDQLRGRGQKSEDGLRVTADEVVFGTFLTKAGKIDVVDVQAREIRVLELNTNKPLRIKLTADSQLKIMPALPSIGGSAVGIPGGSMPGGVPAGVLPAGRAPGGMPGTPGGPAGGDRPPDLAQMLERMPSAKIEDLKPGETVVVSSTKGAASGEVTAIMLLANADMLIQVASTGQRSARGSQGMPTGMGASGGTATLGGMQGGLEGMQLPGIMP